jgi:hypothetical protein
MPPAAHGKVPAPRREESKEQLMPWRRENPATYMLEVSNPGSEAALGVDFSDVYARGDLAR